MIGVIIKNEFLKIKSQKKPIIFIILSILTIFTITHGIASITMGDSTASILSETSTPIEILLNVLVMIKTLIVIFGLLIVIDTFTDDFKNGTIKMSTIQPISRTEIILGKLLYVAFAVFSMYLFVTIVSYIDISIFRGSMNFNEIITVLGKVGLTCLAVTGFLYIISIIATITKSSAFVTCIGILFMSFHQIILLVEKLISWIPANSSYFIITSYFDGFFIGLPNIEHIKLYAFIAISLTLIFGAFASIQIFKRKDLTY